MKPHERWDGKLCTWSVVDGGWRWDGELIMLCVEGGRREGAEFESACARARRERKASFAPPLGLV